VLSQLKRAEQQHERSRKRIWSQIKQCLEREQRIKEREEALRSQLEAERARRTEAERAKKAALQRMNFEEAEKTKNTIRRATKNEGDIEQQLAQCQRERKKVRGDKAQHEEQYMAKHRGYGDKLEALSGKHQEAMSRALREEREGIARREKAMRERLERAEREIQIDEENVEKCKESLEEIEDLIRDDGLPFLEQLEQRRSAKTALELEIEALERTLLEKREELRAVEREMASTEEEIDRVRARYRERVSEIEGEQSRYQQSKAKFSREREDHLAALSALELEAQSNKEAEERFEDEVSALEMRASRIGASLARFRDKKGRESQWDAEERRLGEQEGTVRDTADKIKYEIEGSERALKQIDAQCACHGQTVSAIDSALPLLHSDKTVAVNNEKYLEAGKIHKEIVQKEAQREQSMERLAALGREREDIEGTLGGQREEEHALRQQMLAIQRKRHQLRFDLISDHRRTLRESLSALDKEHDDDVEAAVLALEMAQIEQELAFFHRAYGWDTDHKHHAADDTLSATANPTDEHQLHHDDDDENDDDDDDDDDGGGGGALSAAATADDGTPGDEQKERERTKEAVSEEMEAVRGHIARMEEEKKRILSEINEAVANDQFDIAGQLVPQKKKLIADVAEKRDTLEALEKEMEQCIERESRGQSHCDEEDDEQPEPLHFPGHDGDDGDGDGDDGDGDGDGDDGDGGGEGDDAPPNGDDHEVEAEDAPSTMDSAAEEKKNDGIKQESSGQNGIIAQPVVVDEAKDAVPETEDDTEHTVKVEENVADDSRESDGSTESGDEDMFGDMNLENGGGDEEDTLNVD